MAETTRLEGIYEIRIEQGPALRETEKLTKQLQGVRVEKTALQKETRKLIQEEQALATQVKANGSATEAQAKQLSALRQKIEEKSRALTEAIVVEKGLSGQTRELTNDLSGLTEAGLRFRDKMADATRSALEGSSAFQQFGARSEALKTSIQQANDGIVKQQDAIAKLTIAYSAGAKTEEQYKQELAELNIQLEEGRAAQAGLKGELDSVTQKSARLQEEINKLNAEYREGKISQEEYRKGLQRIEVETRKAAGATFDLTAHFDDFVKNQGQQLRSTLSGLASQYIGVGAAVYGLVRIAGNAIDTLANFDQALSKISALGGEYKANIDKIAEATKTVGIQFGFTAVESASAVEELAKAGVRVDDILGGALQGTLTLAAAGELEVGQAAELASIAMTEFGLSGSEVARVADTLSAGANKALGSVEDLGNALKFVGPVAANMNVTLEETVGTLALFAQSGVKGEQAGTSLRGVISALTSPSKVAADELQRLGIITEEGNNQLFDAQGNFRGLANLAEQLSQATGNLTEEERSAALGRIFGNQQLTAANILYKGGKEAVEEWTDAVTDAGIAERVAREKTDNLRGDIDKLNSSYNAAILSGSTFTKVLRSLVQDLGTDITALGEATSVFELIASVGQASFAGMLAARAKLNEGLAIEGKTIEELERAALFLSKSLAKAQLEDNNTLERVINKRINDIRTQIALIRQQKTAEIDTAEGAAAAAERSGARIISTTESVAQARTRIEEAIGREKAALDGLASTDAVGIQQTTVRIEQLTNELSLLDGKITKTETLTKAQREKLEVEREMAALAAEPIIRAEPISPGQIASDGVTPITPLTDEEQAQFGLVDASRLESAVDTTAAITEQFDLEKQAFEDLQDAKIAAIGAFADAIGALTDKSSDAAKVFFALEKAAAIFQVFVNLQREIAGYAANPTWTLLPDGGATLKATAIAAAKVRAGISVATIAAQAIPGLAEGGETGDPSGTVTSRWGTPVTRRNGDNVLVRTRRGAVTLKTGEKVLNEQQQRRLERATHPGIWGAIGLPGHPQRGYHGMMYDGFAAGGRVHQTHGTALANFRPISDPGTTATNAMIAALRANADRPVHAHIQEIRDVNTRVEIIEQAGSLG